MTRTHIVSIAQALLAAVLFGASAPLAKLLLGEMPPLALSALLYLGSGVGLVLLRSIQRLIRGRGTHEARIGRADLAWLAGAVIAGGVLGPLALLYGLEATPAATASLLLNFESVATTIIAAVWFKEAISRRAWASMSVITLSSVLLSVAGQAEWGLSLGALGVLAACFLWGLDNNLTRHISTKDPVAIVTIKGLGAGSFSFVLAWLLGQPFPPIGTALGAMLLGCFSYGLSIVLFIRALRGLGTARSSALFGTAPLAGVALSFMLFSDSPGWVLYLAAPLTIAGTLFLVTEDHEHEHTHDVLEHNHVHTHDDGHHGHHAEVMGAHSHVHVHESVRHAHGHTPDVHHRHGHEEGG